MSSETASTESVSPSPASEATDFTLLPAIDLRHGAVVRLRQGDDGRRTRYFDDPIPVLERFAAAGARWVHAVDLDAAFGEPPQRELVQRMVAAGESLGVSLELGGGLRDAAAVRWAALGALLLGALGLRLWGAWFGLPHVFHADESNVATDDSGDGRFSRHARALLASRSGAGEARSLWQPAGLPCGAGRRACRLGIG